MDQCYFIVVLQNPVSKLLEDLSHTIHAKLI